MSEAKNDKSIREVLIAKDEVTLVTQDGSFIGPEDKYQAHKYPTKLHLAVSVWLFNSKGQVLLQQRSKQKIVGAGWWANSVCGNVWPTETLFECANRRLKQELGITGVSLTPSFKFSYKAYGNEVYGEYEIDQVYLGRYQGDITPNPAEVSKLVWVDFNELFKFIFSLDYLHADQTLLLEGQELKTKTKPVEFKLGSLELSLAPWTVLMLRDARLHDAYNQLMSS